MLDSTTNSIPQASSHHIEFNQIKIPTTYLRGVPRYLHMFKAWWEFPARHERAEYQAPPFPCSSIFPLLPLLPPICLLFQIARVHSTFNTARVCTCSA